MPHSHKDPTTSAFRAMYTPDVEVPPEVLGPPSTAARTARASGRLATTILAVAGAAALITAPFHLRVLGPADDVAELQARVHSGDSSLATGIMRDSARIGLLEMRVNALESKAELTAYILCMQTRRTDPSMVPPGCIPIVQRGGTP